MNNGGDWVCLVLALTPGLYFIVEGVRMAYKARLQAKLRMPRISMGLPETTKDDQS